MTMMPCPEPIMDPEAQYTDILVNYTIEENQLTLSTEDNRTLVYQVEVEEFRCGSLFCADSQILAMAG